MGISGYEYIPSIMRRKEDTMQRMAGVVAVLAAWALIFSFGSAALAGGGPAGAADAFFGALKKGDMAEARKHFSGAALKAPPQEGSRQYRMMTLWGESYLGVEGLKVEGDKATGFAKLDGRKLAAAMMGPRRAMIDKIADPAQRAKELERFDAGLKSFAAKMSKMPLTLVKKDGKWLVQEIK
jgi:hypothetical protein